MRRQYEDYLNDMREALSSIEEFVGGMTFDEFERDAKTRFAVIRAFEVLGEAAKKVPETVRERYPEIPRKEMTGMRNKLIHEYFAVDTKVLWKTIRTDIPQMRDAIRRLMPDR